MHQLAQNNISRAGCEGKRGSGSQKTKVKCLMLMRESDTAKMPQVIIFMNYGV